MPKTKSGLKGLSGVSNVSGDILSGTRLSNWIGQLVEATAATVANSKDSVLIAILRTPGIYRGNEKENIDSGIIL